MTSTTIKQSMANLDVMSENLVRLANSPLNFNSSYSSYLEIMAIEMRMMRRDLEVYGYAFYEKEESVI